MITRSQGRLGMMRKSRKTFQQEEGSKGQGQRVELHTPQQTVPSLLSLPCHYFNQSYFIVFPHSPTSSVFITYQILWLISFLIAMSATPLPPLLSPLWFTAYLAPSVTLISLIQDTSPVGF